MELDESLLGVLLCTASSSCLSGTGEEAEGALCLVGEGGGGGQRGKERGTALTPHGTEMVRRTSRLVTAYTASLPSTGKRGGGRDDE